MSEEFIKTTYYKEAEEGPRVRCDVMDEDAIAAIIDFLVHPHDYRTLKIDDAWLGEKVARAMRQVFESGVAQGKKEVREVLGIE